VKNDSNLTDSTNVGSYFPPTGSNTPGAGQAPTFCNMQLSAGKISVCTFTLPKGAHGAWEFVCTVTGHFPKMKGYLFAGTSPAPPRQIPVETSVLQLGLLAVAGIIVGLAAFLILMGMSERASPDTLARTPPPPSDRRH
jgi:hypothetical protein